MGKKVSLIEKSIKQGEKVFGFDDVEEYRGHELSTEDIEARQKDEIRKIKMIRVIALSVRELKSSGKIDNIDYKIFACHHGLTAEGKEMSFSAISANLGLVPDDVMTRYSKTITLLRENVKPYEKAIFAGESNI